MKCFQNEAFWVKGYGAGRIHCGWWRGMKWGKEQQIDPLSLSL